VNILHASMRADNWAIRHVNAMHGFPRCFSFSHFIRQERGPTVKQLWNLQSVSRILNIFIACKNLHATNCRIILYIDALLQSWKSLIISLGVYWMAFFFARLIFVCAHIRDECSPTWMKIMRHSFRKAHTSAQPRVKNYVKNSQT